MKYYISIAGMQRGPFAPEQLGAQGLRPDTLVWAEGMAQWERADRVAALQPVVAALPAADPAAQPYAAPGPPFAGAVPQYGQPMGYGNPGAYPAGKPGDKKLVAGLCGIFLGSLGVHKFILGYTTAGVIMLCTTVLTCGLGYLPMHIIGLIEGIMYLAKSDEEFYQTYMVQKKEWF